MVSKVGVPYSLPENQIWDVPASAKTEMGPEMVEETSCALLLLDLDDRNSFRVAKKWHTSITDGEVNSPTRWPCEPGDNLPIREQTNSVPFEKGLNRGLDAVALSTSKVPSLRMSLLFISTPDYRYTEYVVCVFF